MTIRTLCLLTLLCSLAASQPQSVLTSQEAARKVSEGSGREEWMEKAEELRAREAHELLLRRLGRAEPQNSDRA